jgi:hypothetical protein
MQRVDMIGIQRFLLFSCVYLCACTAPLCASSVPESDRPPVVRDVQLSLDGAVDLRPTAREIPVAEFMQPGYVVGPAVPVSESRIAVSDKENVEVYLYDLETGRADSVASFGDGPGEVRNIVDMFRTESGFVVLDNRRPGVTSVRRRSCRNHGACLSGRRSVSPVFTESSTPTFSRPSNTNPEGQRELRDLRCFVSFG